MRTERQTLLPVSHEASSGGPAAARSNPWHMGEGPLPRMPHAQGSKKRSHTHLRALPACEGWGGCVPLELESRAAAVPQDLLGARVRTQKGLTNTQHKRKTNVTNTDGLGPCSESQMASQMAVNLVLDQVLPYRLGDLVPGSPYLGSVWLPREPLP